MSDYKYIWIELGLDLSAHDGLLSILSEAYRNIFLSQKNRPEGIQYFDFVMSKVHNLRIRELIDAKNMGRKAVGLYCVFVPEELILAVDGISVGLCPRAELNFEGAEEVVPRNLSFLIKSAFGFKRGLVCAYIEASDLVVGENTCDTKKKAYEALWSMVNDLYVIDFPQAKSDGAKMFFKAETIRFISQLEETAGRKITLQGLKKAIETVDAKKKAIMHLTELRKTDPPPISGLNALLVNEVFFYYDPVCFNSSVNALCNELEERIKSGKDVFEKGTPRIIVSGCPMAVPNSKVSFLVETSGAVIVDEESFVGERGARLITESKGSTVEELIDSVVDRYFKIDCAVFTPKLPCLDHVKNMCGPTDTALERFCIPILRLETDYSQEDTGQLKTRIEAFIERIKGYMKIANLDVGSRMVKLAVLENNRKLYLRKKTMNSFDPLESVSKFKLTDKVDHNRMVFTSYGRYLLNADFGCPMISEIKAFTVVPVLFFQNTGRFSMIGGQDTKAVSLGEKGVLKNFEINDRVASGTGRFMEIMTNALNCSMDEFSKAAFMVYQSKKINNLCTIFAESEVVSLIAKDARRERVVPEGEILFAGIVAWNESLSMLIAKELQKVPLCSI